MTKFLTTLAFAVCILAVVPACKKAKKESVKVEQAQTEVVNKSVKNDKEDFAV